MYMFFIDLTPFNVYVFAYFVKTIDVYEVSYPHL